MPWNTTATPEQRLKFVTLANSGRFTISELCEQFGVSRKCGHKWLIRFAEGGAKALVDGCRAPHSGENGVSVQISDKILTALVPVLATLRNLNRGPWALSIFSTTGLIKTKDRVCFTTARPP